LLPSAKHGNEKKLLDFLSLLLSVRFLRRLGLDFCENFQKGIDIERRVI